MNENAAAVPIKPLSKSGSYTIKVFATLLTLGAILRALDLDRAAGLILYTEQYLSIMLAMAVPLVFLAVPAGNGRRRTLYIPWYDWVAAVLGLACSIYTTIRYPILAELTTMRPVDGIVVGAIMFVLLIEGLRRTVGWVLPILAIFFFLLALVGDQIPGMLQGSEVPLSKLVYYLSWDSSGILGTPIRIATTIVVAFVFFGQVLFQSGGSSFFTDISTVLMGRFRGGPAKISIFASSIFGSISGSTVSNVVTTGVITIPLMKKGGYAPHLAGAIEAVASTGGQLMPPVMGAAAFLMAEFLAVPYTDVIIAALVPALLYYVALFLEADLEAARKGLAGVDSSKIPPTWEVIKAGWFFPLPFLVLVLALFLWNDLPEKAALRSVAVMILCAVIFGYKGKRLSFSSIMGTLESTGLAVLEIIMIGAAAGIVIGTLYISGFSFGLTLALVQLTGNNLLLLLVMAAVVCIVLGMGMPTVGVYVLLATMVAPALVESGIAPMAAHLFILYFGMMSMITPPVAIGAFAAATLTGADPMRTGYAAMRFGWLAFVIPFMFVASPTLLLAGPWHLVTVDVLTAVMGTCLVCTAVVGFLFRKLSLPFKILMALTGAALMLPKDTFEYGELVNILGLVVGILFIMREWLWKRKADPQAQS